MRPRNPVVAVHNGASHQQLCVETMRRLFRQKGVFAIRFRTPGGILRLLKHHVARWGLIDHLEFVAHGSATACGPLKSLEIQPFAIELSSLITHNAELFLTSCYTGPCNLPIAISQMMANHIDVPVFGGKALLACFGDAAGISYCSMAEVRMWPGKCQVTSYSADALLRQSGFLDCTVKVPCFEDPDGDNYHAYNQFDKPSRAYSLIGSQRSFASLSQLIKTWPRLEAAKQSFGSLRLAPELQRLLTLAPDFVIETSPVGRIEILGGGALMKAGSRYAELRLGEEAQGDVLEISTPIVSPYDYDLEVRRLGDREVSVISPEFGGESSVVGRTEAEAVQKCRARIHDLEIQRVRNLRPLPFPGRDVHRRPIMTIL